MDNCAGLWTGQDAFAVALDDDEDDDEEDDAVADDDVVDGVVEVDSFFESDLSALAVDDSLDDVDFASARLSLR